MCSPLMSYQYRMMGHKSALNGAHPSLAHPPQRCNHYIPVTPANVNDSPYQVTQSQAERMVANGRAVWIPGLKRLRETRPLIARGELREWQQTWCRDPDTGVSIRTLQWVVPKHSREYITRPSHTVSNAKRRPVNKLRVLVANGLPAQV
jgi:hypothetical protein